MGNLFFDFYRKISAMQQDNFYKKFSVEELPTQKRNDNSLRHPVQDLDKQFNLFTRQAKYDRIANIYGSGLAMKMQIEEEMLSSIGRLPGEKKSNLSLNITTGNIDKIGFEDFLGTTNPMKFMPNVHKLIIEDKI